MATALTRWNSRLASFVCGMISIIFGNAYRMMQALIPDTHVKWRFFSVTLIMVGGLTAVMALLPSSWLEWVCKISPNTQGRSSIPIKLLGGFAGFSYLSTIALHLIPLSWHLTAQVVYLLCPACVLAVTVDPSFGTILLVLAPLNAAIYGSLGALLGYVFLAVRNRVE